MSAERDPLDAELELLRIFYACWVGLHTIPRTLGNRRKQEEAAQRLVDAANGLRNFYQSGHAIPPEEAVLNG
jgi:hypothetical protein